MGNLRIAISLVLIMLISTLAGCGGGGGNPLQSSVSAVTNSATASQSLPGFESRKTAIVPPPATEGMPYPPSPLVLPKELGTSLPMPLNELDRGNAARSASDAKDLNGFDPFGEAYVTAGPNIYGYLMSDDPSTPLPDWFNAQTLPPGKKWAHVWGTVTSSNLQPGMTAEIGLVTQNTYDYAVGQNQLGYMFYQNVGLFYALDQQYGLCARQMDSHLPPIMDDTPIATGSAFDFDLRLYPNGLIGGTCHMRVRPRVTPLGAWSDWSSVLGYGMYDQISLIPPPNWPPPPPNIFENFTSSRIIAQIHSSVPNSPEGRMYFRWVRETETEDIDLPVPTVDCTALQDAKIAIADPGPDNLAGTTDDAFLTQYVSTNSTANIEQYLYLGHKFYVFFERDTLNSPTDKVLYPNIPAAGTIEYTTTGLLASPSLAPFFDLPDVVPGYPSKVYNHLNPFALTLRHGAYNRITNDFRHLSWAKYKLLVYPSTTLEITPDYLYTNDSDDDRVVLAVGMDYTPNFYNLDYPEVGADTSPGQFGQIETIYPRTVPEAVGRIAVGYDRVNEVTNAPGDAYYDDRLDVIQEDPNDPLIKHRLVLRADAFCRFELRPNWYPGASPDYWLQDMDTLQGFTQSNLDPRAQPWNTVVIRRDKPFRIVTADNSVSQVITAVSDDPNDLIRDVALLDTASTNRAEEVAFSTTGGNGPYTGTLKVLPSPIVDNDACPPARVR